MDDIRTFWNDVADDWRIQVGVDGDVNRRLNSDPVLWRLAGDVTGLAVLDAGCGTGYLSAKLHERGARVIGVDLSERMIEIARASHPDLDFRVDSCSDLDTIESASIDLIVSNYVLMDTPDLPGTMSAFHRVLKPHGIAILVFSHPCFPQGRATESETTGAVRYTWDFPYFEEQRCTDLPWGQFRSDFIWFHRPLSAYWKAFRAAGFEILDFEEPRLDPDQEPAGVSADAVQKCRTRPYSVAFRLRKVG